MSKQQTSNGWATSYYDLPEGATTLQDLIEDRDMNYAVGNIFKAAFRLGRKRGTDELYDLNKIKWFVEREIARVKGLPPKDEDDWRKGTIWQRDKSEVDEYLDSLIEEENAQKAKML